MFAISGRASLFAFLPFLAALGGLTMAEGATRAETPRVVISGSITRIVVAPQEPAPVLRAARDLASDFAKVFGRGPAIGNSFQNADPVEILIAENGHLPAGVECTKAMGVEAFAFSVASAGPAHRQVVCLVGADMRGTIYAI
jgi:hypothetical protein